MGQVETKLSESFHEELQHRYLRSSNPYNGDMCAPDAPVLLRKAFLCLSKLLRSFRLSRSGAEAYYVVFVNGQ